MARSTLKIAPSCVFAFNSNIDLIARPSLAEVEEFFGEKIASGCELAINAKTAKRIANAFDWKEERIGGQAGNMANAAAALGVKCLAHCYNLSPQQEKLFSKNVEVVGEETGIESIHYILEVMLRNGARDRIIATYDPAAAGLKISPEFASRSTEFIANGCSRAVVSGFHLIHSTASAKSHLKIAANLIRKWRKANPELHIHFEAGDFAEKKVIQEVAKTILPLVDSVGMNEKEMPCLAPFLACLDTKEVVIHTALYASAISWIRKPKKLVGALRFGHALAAHKAMTGKNAGMQTVQKLLAKHPTRMLPCKNGVSVPSFQLKPKFTVGLGDSFAVGCFLFE